MIEAIKLWFYPEGLSRKEKIDRIRQRDREISEAISKQVEELETALQRKQCTKLSHSAKSGQG